MTPTRLPIPTPAEWHGMTYPAFRWLLDDPSPGAVVVGVSHDNRPAGLAVGLPNDGHGTVLSVYVRPELRRQGIGSVLLAAVERELAAGGAAEVSAEFSGPADGPAGRLFARGGWANPYPRVFLVYARREMLAQMPWPNVTPPPRGFEVFPWAELTAADRESILTRQQQGDGWFPEVLSPFVDEPMVDRATSLGLRQNGEVIGWQVNHRIAADTHRFTATWVRKDLLKAGRAIALMAEAVRRYLAGGLPKATMGIHADNAPMLAFLDRRIRPFVDAVNPIHVVRKPLAVGW